MSELRVSIDRVIGPISLRVGAVSVAVRVEVPRVLQVVRPLVRGGVPQVRGQVRRLIGRVLAVVRPEGNIWEAVIPQPPKESIANPFCPRIDGYVLRDGVLLLRTQMAGGGIRQRRRWEAAVLPLQVTLTFAANQLAGLEDLTAIVGAGWFQLPIMLDGTLTERQARFAGPYQISRAGPDIYDVELDLEVRP